MASTYTLDYLLALLTRRDALTVDQADDIRIKGPGQKLRVARELGGDTRARDVSPAQLVASLDLRTPEGVALSEDRITQMLASEAGFPYEKIDPLKLDPQLVTSTLSRPFAKKHSLIPLHRTSVSMRVATDDPFNYEAFEGVQRLMSGGDLEIVIAARTDIQRLIREIWGFRRTVKAAEADLISPIGDIANLEGLVKLKSLEEIEGNDKHIINAVEYLLHYALSERASDIHIEPKRSEAMVRLRIDGVLHMVQHLPKVVHAAMVNRIKTMARLDIAEKRRPQDGRIKISHGEVEVELRVSTLPVAFGEKLVVRIFDPMILLQDLEKLGFAKADLDLFLEFIHRPNGLVLVTGPTGSGKTTTLYSALQHIASDHVNVTTIEDPIEMVVEAFNQTAVHPKAGLTFASALRTILRQDPDIIMVGEIRDAETANNAIQAALTGHLVLSTIHTNDSASAVTRMVDLGAEPFLVGSTVVGVIAQRLVRKVCTTCRKKGLLTRQQIVALGMPLPEDGDAPRLPVWHGEGCPDCRNTGLRGRTGIFEVMPVTERIQKLIIAEASAIDIMKAAQQDGMKTLREAAIHRLAEGVTSFAEVLRVTVD